MTTTDQERDTAFEREQRRAFVAGLRELADFLEVHPGIPVASFGTLYLTLNVYGLSKTDIVFAVRTPNTGPWDKRPFGSQYEVSRTFGGGVKLALVAARGEVCERVVVGQVTVDVPEQAFVPAHTETRDVTEWKCLPLLGD
jgi:hypothetical protein